MLGYLYLDIICSSKLTVFLECTTFADNACRQIFEFSCQMEAIVQHIHVIWEKLK